MRIEHVEVLIEDHHAGIALTADRAYALRDHIRNGSAPAEPTPNSSAAPTGPHRPLDNQRRKLLQAHYGDAIASDLFKSEQQRITREMETASARLEAMEQVFVDIEETLDQALAIGQDCHRAFLAAGPKIRRLMNQAFFERLFISDDQDTVRSELAEPFAILLGEELTAEVETALATEAKNRRPTTGRRASPPGQSLTPRMSRV